MPLAIYGLAGLYLPLFGIPPVAKATVLSVSEELAKRVAREEAALPRGRSFIFADGKYQLASELAFYLRAPERVYSQNVIGGDGLSFNYWSDLESLREKDALFVSHDTSAYLTGALQQHFTRVDPPEPIEFWDGRRLVARFFLTRCYGYKGPAPSRVGTDHTSICARWSRPE